jgi:hypothetical protein
MIQALCKLLGISVDPASLHTEYEPVYGLPKRAVEEWLARNPQLNEEYEAQLRQRTLALKGGEEVRGNR